MGAPRATPYQRLAVVGGGAWGSALAAVAARAGRDVVVWARRAELAAEIDAEKRNRRYFGDDVALPAAVRATADLAEATAGAEAALLVVPSVAVREAARALAAVLPAGAPVVLCAKGIERDTGLLMSDVVIAESPGRAVGVLSGPTFADEVVRDLPTAVTIASNCAAEDGEASVAARMALSLGTERFRPYLSDDMTGAEVGGTVKNVIAIACGMAEGAGFGSNARAALITRGLDEIKTLADALGGRRETVTGLSGVGDLMLTASSTQSRNFSYGVQMGQGVPVEKLFGGRKVVVEGVENALSVTDLARRRGVRMPICEAVRTVVHEGVPFERAFEKLWTAPIESEPRALDLELAHPAGERVA
ncbi:MAG: NAD(P)-dependent glycerol-3-phosphate dehydrogenase [Rhodobacteraceae bacterium]|nr:MAG: NAD(P)-dependent glycerol-3-phosphate dehydrogenase [Paracoccaceae bacterium]